MSSRGLSIAQGGLEPPLREISMAQLLSEAAKRYPKQDAVVSVWQQKTLTFEQLEAEAHNAAAALLAYGIGAGDRVGIWSANRIEWLIVQFAVARIGAILVNVNPAYRQTELGYVIGHAKCKALFLAPAFRTFNCVDAAQAVRATSDTLEHLIVLDETRHDQTIAWADFVARGKDVEQSKVDELAGRVTIHQPVSIQYTSGTTGAPKGATLSHFNLVNNGALIGARLRLRETDRICLPVPLFHCFGMVIGVLGAFAHGAAVVFASEAFDAGACLAAVAQERCTAIYGVPMMFIAMQNHADFDSSRLTTLRTGLMGGAPCPAEIIRAAIEKMHMKEIAVLYGMTETAPISLQGTPEDSFDQRVHSVGLALPHTEVKVVDAAGATVPLGTPGELCIRGYLVMLGYWENPDATAKAVDADGWMHSGDLAVMRDDHYVAIVGRIKDMVIRGGENVFPREIEEFLHTLAEVAEAQVFGIPDDVYGEQVCAWIRLKPGATLDEQTLRSRCKGHIASFKIPHYVRFVTEYPTTASGKVQKFRMREIEIEQRRVATAQAI
jgi:fatty-acyl-CoA synthase